MLPPLLELYVVWHPDDDAGRAVARQITEHFQGAAYTGLIAGAVAVYHRCAPWDEQGAPRPVPFPGDPWIGGVEPARYVAVLPVLQLGMAAAVLTRFARPSPKPLPPEVADVFGRDDLAWYERHLADRARITALWRQVEAIASTLTVADFEARARAAGLALPAAFGLLEHVVGQPAARAGWPGAAPAPAAHRRAGLASPVR